MSTVIPPDFVKINLQNPQENKRLQGLHNPAEPSSTPEPRPHVKDLALSNSVNTAMKTADFDEEKVRQIAEAIKMGNYPLDARKIAESFVPLEKLI